MKRFLLFIFFVGLSITSANAQWQQLSEPEGGNFLDLAIKGDTVYTSVANQIYRSTDDGVTWELSEGNLPEFADINSIGATSNAVYAGVNDGGSEDKFFVSYDGGDTWTQTGGKGATILGVRWETIGDTAFVQTNFGGVHRTRDNGATFDDLPGVGFTGNIDVWGNDLFYLGQGSVRLSTNRGDSLSEKIGTSSIIQFNFGLIRTAIRMDTVFIAGAQGIFRMNSESVWEYASEGMPTFLGSPTPIISKLANVNGDVWAFSNEGIFVSADTASTWKKLDLNVTTGFIQKVRFEGDIIHMATENGYYISDGKTDSTITFSKRTNGLLHVNITGIRSFDDDLYIFGQSMGLLKSSNEGSSFEDFGGNIGNRVFTDLAKNDTYFVATDGFMSFRSMDGVSWDTLKTAPASQAIGAKDSLILASSGSQIYRSADNGDSWAAVNPAFSLGGIAPNTYAFHDSVIFGGFRTSNFTGAISRSRDNGLTWEATPGAGDVNHDIVFIGDTAYTNVQTIFTGGGVAKSGDFGDSWELLDNALNEEIGGVFELELAGDTFFATTFEGIYKSTDGARTWEKINVNGLPNQFFFSGAPLKVHQGGLYYAPGNASLFKTDIDATSTSNEIISDQAIDFRLDQNYPNPFNPSTNINFSLSETGLVSLKVYNLLGQEVAELVNQRMGSGAHTINFDASGLASGVYIYRLISGNQVQTKKMMLIK